MKIPNAIILIEAAGDEIIGIHAFTPDAKGRAEAEAAFFKLAGDQTDVTEEGKDTTLFSPAQIAEGWAEGRLSSGDEWHHWSISFHTAEP